MKKIAFICILVIVIIAGCAQKKSFEKTILGMGTDYYVMPETIKGKVKEVKERNYWAIEKDGKLTKGDLMTWKELDSIGSTKNFIAYFDNTGLLTRYDRLDDQDAIVNSAIATIENSKWTRIENKIKDTINTYNIPQYDNLGYFTGVIAYRPVKDTLLNKQVLTNDEKGNYTKLEVFNYKGQRIFFQDFSINPEGKVIEVRNFNMQDSLTGGMINTYNDKGQLIKQKSYSEKPKSESIWDYNDLSFDDHGNWLESFCNIDDGKYKIIIGRSYIYY